MDSQSFLIEQTPKTPLIDLNQFTGELLFAGKSIPENAAKVYEPVFKWVTEYIQNPRLTTNLRLNLEYFNTATSIWLVKILKVLIQINLPDYVFFIHLYLPLEDFDEMKDFEDIRDVFSPITDIFQDSPLSVGIKLYGTDDKGNVIKDTLVFL
jgi:hypothetical protein